MGTDGGTHHMSWMQLKMRVVAAAWLRSDWWWLLRYHRNHHRGSYPYRRFPLLLPLLLPLPHLLPLLLPLPHLLPLPLPVTEK